MAKADLSAQRLRELLDYDQATGVFRWKVHRAANARVGDIAGCDCGKGYLKIGIDWGLYRAHRLAWLYVYGTWPDGQIDHRDGNKKNNRLSNLRLADDDINAQNRRKARRDNKLGVLGVTRYINGRYTVKLGLNGKQKHIGYYATIEEAQEAYLQAKRKYHPGCTI